MKLRYFNQEGIKAFRDYLKKCKENPFLESPFDLLENPLLTVPKENIELERRYFATKRDLGEYLHATLSSLSKFDLERSSGLWTWLTLFYFDTAAPKDAEGKREIKEEKRYIFDFSSFRNRGVHLLQQAWRIIDIAPRFNRLISSTAPDVTSGVCWFIMSSTFVTRIKCIFEVMDRLYWDEKKGGPKHGMLESKTRPGTLKYRFFPRIHQLEKNYDLTEIDADTFIDLLGKEFRFGNEQKTFDLS